jgi:hypothetical protein
VVRFSMRFSGARIEHEAVHVDARQVDGVGVEAAGLDDLLDLDHADPAGHDAAGLKLRAVRRKIRLPLLSAFQALASATRVSARVPSRRHAPSNSRTSLPSATRVPTPVRVKKAGMPAPPARRLFGQRALGREFQLQLAGQVLALELLVLADVAADHLA